MFLATGLVVCQKLAKYANVLKTKCSRSPIHGRSFSDHTADIGEISTCSVNRINPGNSFYIHAINSELSLSVRSFLPLPPSLIDMVKGVQQNMVKYLTLAQVWIHFTTAWTRGGPSYQAPKGSALGVHVKKPWTSEASTAIGWGGARGKHSFMELLLLPLRFAGWHFGILKSCL